MEIAVASDIQSEWRGEAMRAGKMPRKWLLAGEDESGFSFRIVRSEYQPGEDAFLTPRHRHAFRQICWSEKGALNFAPGQDVLEGDTNSESTRGSTWQGHSEARAQDVSSRLMMTGGILSSHVAQKDATGIGFLIRLQLELG